MGTGNLRRVLRLGLGAAVFVGMQGCTEMLADLDAALADQDHRGEGLRFKYPSGWSVSVEEVEPILHATRKVVSVSEGDKHVFIDLVKPKVPLDAETQAQLCAARTLQDKKSFSAPTFGATTSSPISRELAGEIRTGQRWRMTVEWKMDSDDEILCDVYVFEAGDRTIGVAAGGRAEDAAGAEAQLGTVMGSLVVEASEATAS